MGGRILLTQYIQVAMSRATYERIEDGSFYGEIPGFEGVYANADTEEACREELREVLEGWILLSLNRRLAMPVVDGIDLSIREVA